MQFQPILPATVEAKAREQREAFERVYGTHHAVRMSYELIGRKGLHSAATAVGLSLASSRVDLAQRLNALAYGVLFANDAGAAIEAGMADLAIIADAIGLEQSYIDQAQKKAESDQGTEERRKEADDTRASDAGTKAVEEMLRDPGIGQIEQEAANNGFGGGDDPR